jgi:hypothetical protein
MNGPQHYAEGERHLSSASYTDRPGGSALDPAASAYHLQAARAHFAAAQVAVEAALLVDRYIGDGPHINEWRTVIGHAEKASPAASGATQSEPHIPGQPYAEPVETALRNLNLAGYVTPADTLNAAISVLAGQIAEALVDGETPHVRNWARGMADELRRVGLDLRGAIERRAEELGGLPFSYDTPSLGYSDDPPF